MAKQRHRLAVPCPKRLFNSSLEGSPRHAKDVSESQSIDVEAFKAHVRSAIELNAVPQGEKKAKFGCRGLAEAPPRAAKMAFVHGKRWVIQLRVAPPP